MTAAATLAKGLEGLGIALPEEASGKLLAYVDLLLKWNRTYNLTAIREPERMVSHHLIDSLAVLPHLPQGSLVDVGSGGGLPGIPIAIAQPQRQLTLNDSNHKKGAFLQQAAIELGLANVDVHIGRAEAWRPIQLFDGAISRAFAELIDFISACGHLVRPGGFFAAMKGLHPHEEIARVPLGMRCDSVVKLTVPLVEGDRHLVLCRNVNHP
jgi:16S rRNA (guanine527-N7)-methyltransferase